MTAPLAALVSGVATVARLVLVAVTLVCLASMGGAMLFAFPLLVPLHWLASAGRNPFRTAGWALLAGLSVFEGGWMMSYGFTRNAGGSAIVGAVAGLVVAVAFLWGRADAAARSRLSAG